ncbi:mediator of RNA polymerase II transcription subunit 13-like isoform X1 [Hordeum vulgare subsp. vulgare]|uniref:mediator of RNA polymerase II transcription subunit 13-like isoform X1 n=1 Tax=Hordeum vulgare subsp. vulgare TaxID=112509 RepID=UPI001D1A415D|nr:mediator of RNA polymerase II transcription subunit 13-like isoform X1 [Hordeum vulgare subsp. vulgare]XP_044968117.1 mediator of RNA polymerase II transcription subunit 13-like isoform X1 [Hordeum vulgare subsp. vulgare]XP_044968118.1 mediator of RNA polymerase II transcription subunit 13-like isoform X1 [Hordeum vulgare subsp. vulgare]
MWTNIFKIGELQTVSWFQFLPIEPDYSATSDRSSKAEQKDALNNTVLSAYLRLQSEGLLSTWTNSFVGPWDPSQGEHNPDEKIKLWLFLSGRHSSVPEMTQPAVAKLRVVSSDLWVAPGNSEEVAAALCQALRNSLERALRGLSYARFGDVFTKYNPPTRNQNSFRRAQPTVEFVFAATEEAIFVHVIISARYMRNLSSDDIEKVLTHTPRSVGEGLPVIVAPSGMLGRLVGCCPSDLARQVYSSKLSAPNLPGFTQPTICQLRGQSYYVEVALGFPPASTDKISESENNQIKKEFDSGKDPHLGDDGQQKLESADGLPVLERTFIYPPEAVMVPMVHQAFVRFSSKRMWSQDWMSSSSWEAWPFWNFSPSSYFRNSSSFFGSSRGLGVNSNFLRLRRQRNNNSNGMASSISSVSSTSNGSEHAVAAKGGDLLADADSTACHQSDLPLNNDIAGSKMVSKRSRSEITEVSSHAGNEVRENMQGTNGQGGCSWGWGEEGVVMDINILLSEFGDFSDFFQEDELDFGEPPGTAESHALVTPASEFGDMPFIDSPSIAMDIPEQRLSPVGFTSMEAFNHETMSPIQDVASKVQEPLKEIASPAGSQSLVLSSSRSDFLTRAEATLTFAPEYAAVEISSCETPATLFTNPYLPGSKKRGSCGFSSRVYSYDVTQSSKVESAGDKSEKSDKLTPANLSRDVGRSSLYTLVQGRKNESEKSLNNADEQSCKGETSRPVSGETSFSSSLTIQKKSDSMLNVGYFLLSMKTALATEIECITFQAAMCRIRHTLVSLRTKASAELKSALSSAMQTESSSNSGLVPKYEMKRKETIPARLSSDVDHDMYDRSLLENVGVWRSVVVPKGAKPLDSLSAKTFTGTSPSVQRQPIVELLSAMALLVQQSTSFVDIALDIDDGDGSFFWLSLDEQRRRGFSCDPSMVHAGCGGLLGTCHSKDCAGVDLVDPLSAEVSESSMIGLLQSDIKSALKTAFANMDGPLSVIDWCRGRSNIAESAAMGDAYSFHYTSGDIRDTSNSIPIGGDAMSPPQSSNDRGTSEEHHKGYHRVRPTIAVLPSPSLLVGYQDDWLKTSADCLKLWEKAPLEPYASAKPVTYYALCPDIDMLTSAATDFFMQLGTIYEVCKLGTHSPQHSGGQIDQSPGKYLPSGLVLVDCPDQLKTSGSHSVSISSVTEYFQALSKSWSVKSFISSLARIIKDIKLTLNISTNQKESSNMPCTVVYVVCPFPEPSAVLQTLVESSVALGSILSSERERKSFLYTQVAKALNSSASADEASASNVVMLSGFSVPKFVLQIVTVETLLRLHKPNELAAFKDIAFTIYNKARRIPRFVSTSDMFQSPTYMSRPQSTMMHTASPGPTLWKECLVPRMSGQTLSRETEFDASMRSVSWDNSWQPGRAAGLPDPSKIPELCAQDDRKYAFEPLFILAEPGAVDYNDTMESSRFGVDASSSRAYSSISGGSDSGASPLLEGSENDSGTSLHCCYGWTEDWRWLVCIWTDSRGELLDSLVFPFGGISSRQDTKVLQSLFIQILQQGCQIMSSSPEASNTRSRDVIITRIGGFLELEIQEWQKAIYSFGGNEVKKWPVQLRRSIPDGIPSNSNGPTLQQQDMGLIQDRNMPSSPSTLYSPHSKSSFTKGQPGNKKQILAEQTGMDSSRGSLHLVRSISLVAVSQDSSLHLACQADLLATRPTSGEGNQSSTGSSSYLDGFAPVKSIGSMSASYLLVPSPSMRYLSPATLQLPTCLTSESPPLAHLLHSKGTATPLAMGYVVSKAVPPVRMNAAQLTKEDRHSVLSVSIVDYYGGGTATVQEKMSRGVGGSTTSKQARNISHETSARDYEMDMHNVLEAVAAELHALSWMTVSPVYTERRSALPFHCDMVLRLRRLLHYADRHLSQLTVKGEM